MPKFACYRMLLCLCMWCCSRIHIYACLRMYKHHHHIALVARISLTLSHHSSLSFIALGRSSGQHPVSSHSCWMYVRAGRPAFARPCVGIQKSTSLMSSSLLLQQYPASLVRLTWIVFVIGGRWPYSWCLVGCCWTSPEQCTSMHYTYLRCQLMGKGETKEESVRREKRVWEGGMHCCNQNLFFCLTL